MNRRRAIAWLGAVLAAFWFFGAMGAGRFVDCFQPGDYVWLLAGREMLEDPASAWDAPWVGYWRPVTKAFFAGASWLFGGDAASYVSLALLLHVLNGLLIADIALKFRAGPIAAAVGSLCFLLGRHHMVVLDSVAGLSVLFPAFLGLLGLRLSIARGTGSHIAAIFVLAAALWARESYAALPLVVILLLPGEERGWAHLTPRFALSLAILSAGYICIRLFWQGRVPESAQAELERAVDGSASGLLTNLWALLRVATIPPRHVNPDGFWVALLFLLMLLSFSTHLKISRHRILRLLFGALLVFLPSALLRPQGAHEAIAFAEPHHLYAPASFVALAVCLLITLRPTDQRADGEGYEETCMRAIGELLTLTLLLVLAIRNADAHLARAETNRINARATADQLQALVPWIEASEPGRPLLLVRQRREGSLTLPGDARALGHFAEWTRAGRGADLSVLETLEAPRLRELDRLPRRQWIASLRPGIQELAPFFWSAREKAYLGSVPSNGRWMALAPASADAAAAEFELQGREHWLDWSPREAYGSELAVALEPTELVAEPEARIAPRQAGLVPPSELLLLLKP
ncbi:MAG: hypothetical protein JNM84_03785 [Planctomycetes bacterium]|nr:hypothetical protein [Planctomycetota bacterium]